MKPFQLSLCGATSLTHESVSALLRLPVLTDLRIDGCPKIQALDKMRLIAKVQPHLCCPACSFVANSTCHAAAFWHAGLLVSCS